MSYPSPAHALAAIAKELGAEGLQFDETGLARINIGKNLVVAFGQGVRSDCLDFLAEIPLKIDQLSKETASRDSALSNSRAELESKFNIDYEAKFRTMQGSFEDKFSDCSRLRMA